MTLAPLVVTIDGTAGCGKSTVARKVAKRLQCLHLNSGLLFRSLAFESQARSISISDGQSLAALATELSFEFSFNSVGGTEFTLGNSSSNDSLVNDGDISKVVLRDEYGELASELAVHPEVRMVFLELQRSIVKRFGRVVVEGRDAGAEVFPDALAKFYIDADIHVRTIRRLGQLQKHFPGCFSYDAVRERLERRDSRDMNRKYSPQRPAPDAVFVDTSKLAGNKVVNLVDEYVKRQVTCD